MQLRGIDIRRQIAKTFRNPGRLAKLADPDERRRFRRGADARLVLEHLAAPWKDEGSFVRREYSGGYDDYVAHQRSKLAGTEHWVVQVHDPQLQAALAARMSSVVTTGSSVLCLGARTGGEVRAFHELGCFAVGVDLSPGPGTAYVLEGDFHALVFPDACVDAVYCNSLDHVFDIDRFATEARRVLKADGRLLVELPPDERSGQWESFGWRDVDALVAHIADAGFELESRRDLRGYPWDGGESLVFGAR